MRDNLGNLRCKHESYWSFGIPSSNSRERRSAIERAVHFHGVELGGVVSQVFAFGQAFRIERTGPSIRGERRCPDAWVRHSQKFSLRVLELTNTKACTLDGAATCMTANFHDAACDYPKETF